MVASTTIRVAFVQRLLPLYRLGFYKAFSDLDRNIHITILCEQGFDTVNKIETISPELFTSSTNRNSFLWKNTKTCYYHRWRILWQQGIIGSILKREYDVLLFSNNMSHLFYWLLILFCKIKKVKIVFWSHGLQGNENGFKLWLKKWYLSLADVNLVYANYNKSIMCEAGLNEKKIKVVYNSLNYQEHEVFYNKYLTEDKTTLKFKSKDNTYATIIFVSRLEKPKKVDLLLKAVCRLKEEGVLVNVLIVGDGTELGKLIELAENLKIQDQVDFKGSIYKEEELAKLFLLSDLFVSPGNVGLNCIHALSYGLPVITHNDFRYQNPEVEAIINYKTGLFFRKDDAFDLAEKVNLWISEYHSKYTADEIRQTVFKLYHPKGQATNVADGILLAYEHF